MNMLEDLIKAFTVLPGVGPKSAQRMALHLLERDRQGGERLAELIQLAMQNIGHCAECQTLTEKEICDLCSAENRDNALLCVVENPSDVLAIEQSHSYRGRYFVLRNHLSPLDGIGPEEIGIPLLLEKIMAGDIREVILATGATVEGEATAFYIAERLDSQDVSVSRIAHGIPIGGELEYVDGNTLSRALEGRLKMGLGN